MRGVASEGAGPQRLALHQDHGAPMKNASFKAKLEHMGVNFSYSRPSVSDDNPYSESLFRTVRYSSLYPKTPFASLENARTWSQKFVDWYNHEHLHTGIGFVSPRALHAGTAAKQLERRRSVYVAARKRHPHRFPNGTRRRDAPATVWLNPSRGTKELLRQEARAA
jgi:putative transposase